MCPCGVYGLLLGGAPSSAHVLSVHQILVSFTLTNYDAASVELYSYVPSTVHHYQPIDPHPLPPKFL